LVYGVSLYRTSYAEGVTYDDANSNNSYDNGEALVYNLSYTDDDAVSMTSTLEGAGWEDVTLRCLGDGNTGDDASVTPSKANLFADIEALAFSIGEDDTVLVYFSGHGTYDDDGTVYFIPYGGIEDTDDAACDYSLCVTADELDAELAKLPTTKVIVILDTCYSGAFVNAGSGIDGLPADFGNWYGDDAQSAISAAFENFGELLAANAEERGAPAPIYISAAGAGESSMEESGYDHGIFTYYLLAAAEDADDNGDGYVTTTEAYAYCLAGLENYSSSMSAQMSGYDYLPHISGGSRDLVLYEVE